MNYQRIIQQIVEQARELKDISTTENKARVNYACIFSQSKKEYKELETDVAQYGKLIKETKMGNVYLVEPIQTWSGLVKIVKIRKPDPERPERGDADFTVRDYKVFKKEYLDKPGFSLIERPDMEMIELADPNFNVLAYFSNPTLGEVLGIN
ncbi:MAG: hypothetical protein ACNFW9_00775 [Candidatus Kerfeldbacteria bacterium]|jgi:hypothetical protein